MSEGASADSVTLANAIGSAHDAACRATARFARLAVEGHPGVLRVMSSVHKAFIDNVTNPRRRGSSRTALDAEAEWRDMVVSAVNLVSADMPAAPSCDCDGALTALIVNDPTRPDPTPQPLTDGATALATQPLTADDLNDPTSEARTSWWPRDLGPVLSGEQTEPPPTVLTRSDGQALWYAGKINGLIGESESGKTWVALLAVAQELAAGHRVLYLDFEDAAPGIVSRLKALGTVDDDLDRLLDYADPAESLHAAASGDLGELLRTRNYTLIVVDGFNASMTLLGLDLMSNTDVTKFFQLLLRPLAKTGSAVAYVDHIGKNAADDSKGGIGAQAKRAMTTGCVIKVKVGEPFGRGMTGRLHLGVDKDRAGHVRGASAAGRDAGTARLSSDFDSGSVEVVLQSPDTSTRTQRRDGAQSMLMEKISDWLNSSPETTSLRALRREMGGKGEDVDKALDHLVRTGYVYRAKAGSGFSHTLLKRYSVASDLAGEYQDETGQRVPVSHRVPTVSQTQGPGPSNDRVPVSPPYRGDTDTSTEAGARTHPESGPSVSRVETQFSTAHCNRCGTESSLATIAAFKGICFECDRKDRS
jgi:hypothetical protein